MRMGNHQKIAFVLLHVLIILGLAIVAFQYFT